MKKKIGESELHKLAEYSDTDEFYDVFESLLDGENLRAAFRAAIEGAYSEEDTMTVLERAVVDFAQRVEDRASLFPVGICIPEGDLREAYAQGITRAHAKGEIDDKSKYLATSIADVAALSCDEDFLRDVFEHAADYDLEGYAGRVIDTHQIIYQDDLDIYREYKDLKDSHQLEEAVPFETKWADASGSFDTKAMYFPPRFDDDRVLGPLDFTKLEKYAIKIYEGVKPYADNGGRGPLSSAATSYMTLNAMFFDGVENELERIFEDGKDLIPEALFQADEILDRSLDLFSAMYKYGKRMPEDKTGYRVDRASSAKKVFDEGHTVSSFSTSMKGYSDAFTKKRIALVEVIVRRGTPCADFHDVLGHDDYTLSGEREILVAPYVRVTSKKPRKPQGTEEQILDYDNKVAQAVYEMETVPSEKSHELTEMEKADYERKLAIFKDPVRRKKAATFMAKLMNLRLSHWSYTSNDALKCINREDLKQYMEWKAAFQDVYRYRTREIMLEIDRGIEEAQKKGEPLYYFKMYDEEQESKEAELDNSYVQEEIEGIDEVVENQVEMDIEPKKEEDIPKPLSEEEKQVLDEVKQKDVPKIKMSEIEEMTKNKNPEKVLNTGSKILDAIEDISKNKSKDDDQVK